MQDMQGIWIWYLLVLNDILLSLMWEQDELKLHSENNFSAYWKSNFEFLLTYIMTYILFKLIKLPDSARSRGPTKSLLRFILHITIFLNKL